METTVLENVRFKHLHAKYDIWSNANPIILPGELALVEDNYGRMKIKIGSGLHFTDTSWLYSMDRWSANNYKELPTANDTNVKPDNSAGYNTEDFIQISGDIIYPINLTTSVRLSDNSNLQTWMDNIKTDTITLKDNTTTGFKGITGQVSNDAWRIGGGATDNGYMEIATADSGTEPIYVRQYTGDYQTVTRTLTLLDSGGNSLFPGDISEKGKTLESKYLQRSGALPMLGTLDMGVNSIILRTTQTGNYHIGVESRNYDQTKFGSIGFASVNGIGEYMFLGFGDEPWMAGNALVLSAQSIKFKDNTVWHAGNDGSDSGLDADLLDGKHATAFSLTDHTHTKSQITDFPTSLKNPNALTISLNGTSQGAYDGSAAKSININAANVGARPAEAILLATNCDLNTIRTEGEFYINGTNSITNKPAEVESFGLWVQRTAEGLITQKLTSTSADATKNKIYIRTYRSDGNVWTDWDSLYSTRYKPTPADIGAAPTVHGHNALDSIIATASTGSSDMNKYTKVATFKVTANYGFSGSIFECIVGGHGGSVTDNLRLLIWIKQQAALGSNPYIYIAISEHVYNIEMVKFCAQVDETTSTYTTISLYAKLLVAYSHLRMYRTAHTATGVTANYLSNSSFITALPNDGYTVEGVDVTNKHLHSDYLPLNGDGVMTAGIYTSYINTSIYDNVIAKSFNVDSITGTVKIALPVGWNKTMMQVHISVFNYNGTDSIADIIVAGYNYIDGNNNGYWVNAMAYCNNTRYANLIRLAYDGTKCCILIGNTTSVWEWPKFTVTKVVAGHDGHNKLRTGWDISIIDSETDLTNIRQITINSNLLSNSSRKLETPRKIGNANFDGTADITVAGIGAAASNHNHDSVYSKLDHTHNYLSTDANGNVGQPVYFAKGISSHHFTGVTGTVGYVLFAELKIVETYQNTPIIFEIIQRGSIQPTLVTVTFGSVDTNDPGLSSITYYGANIGIHIHKSAASTWNLYCTKSQGWDYLEVTRVAKDQTYNTIEITWKNIQASELPSGAVAASFRLSASETVKLATARAIGNANFDGTANITLAQIGAAPANLVYKNITIATSAWNTTTKIYEYANASITANHVPQVFFSTATLDVAGKAGITVYTETGKIIFKCTTIPTASVVVETAILTPV